MDVVAKAQDGTSKMSRAGGIASGIKVQWGLGSEVSAIHANSLSASQCLTLQSFVSPVEAYAYEQLVPQLEQQGLTFLGNSGKAVEPELGHLPYINLTEQLDYLTKFHNANVQLDYSRLALHQWLPEHNQMTLACFNPAQRRLLAAILDSLCYDFQHLFMSSPGCLITGDSRLTNWQRNKEGSLILINLRRVSLGNPAVDLATLLPELPSLDDCHNIAQQYLQVNPYFKRSVEKLTADVLAATVWLKVDTCRSVFCEQESLSQMDKDFYFDQVPLWLVDLMCKQVGSY